MRAGWLALPMVLAAAHPAASQDRIDCKDPQAQQHINYCAAKDYETADAELNAIWKKARDAAREVDKEQENDLKGAEKALLSAQRGWIAYRDGHCTLAGFDARGGSMEPMLVSTCMTDLTRKRIGELKEFVEGAAR